MSIPFHKQTNPNKQAGQVTYKITVVDNNYPNGIPYEEWVKPPQPIRVELTLNDYIARKTDVVNVAFTKWFEEYNKKYGLPPAHVIAQAAWEAALNNGKVS